MKVLHAYCLNYNLGDYALGMGVKNLLREYLDIDLIAETNLQGTLFNEYYIDNVVNKNYDLLVIGGGGIIHGAHWPNGWFWLIEEELIDRINIPFIVYGAGYNYFQDEVGIPEIGRSHLLKTIEKSSYFSLRNDESIYRFEQQINKQVNEVPDPGFHINLGKKYECPETEPFILIQLANDKPQHRFGSLEKRAIFISEMRKVVSQLVKKYKVIFSPHVFDDIELSNTIGEGFDNAQVWSFSQFAFDNCRDCLGYYDKAEFVLAMRGHGQIVPIAFNTPVLSLENHPKHSGLMRKLGLEEYNLAIDLENFADALLGKISLLESNKIQYRLKTEKINAELNIWSKKAFHQIKKSICY